MRLAHIAKSPPSPHHFTILVRAIPKSKDQSFDDTVNDFFTSYYASTYLSHQIIYRAGKVQKLMNDAEDVCKRIVRAKDAMDKKCLSSQIRCGLCIGISDSVQLYRVNFELDEVHPSINANYTATKECASAFVFFKTRYAALVATQILQTSNPMSWVIDLAPKPNDVYWSNLWIPYRQLWFRRIATLLATIAFMIVFLIPVTFVQGLTQLEQLQQRLPFLRGLLKEKFMSQLITGYLPSVILILFLYTVPPIMKFFSSVEGPISYSARKKSACSKVLYFTIWNVFFVNVLSGSIISQLDAISSPKAIPIQLAKAVPTQATFFITYVLTSGWASLCSEAVLLFPLIVNFVRRKICKKEMDPKSVPSFPYDTEVPRVLLFGLVGFTCSTLAPLILPFLLVYFCLGYIVYRNQILNVYCSKYETGGQLWPIMHNTTIFSLVLSQIIALGVFGIKRSPVASGFTIPLIILTLIFNEYCRQRFYPTFKTMPSQDIIDMDHEDEKNDRMEIILQQLHKAYCQFPPELTEEEETADDGGLNSVEVGECSGEKELAQSPNHRVESLLQPSPNHKVESLHQPSSIGSPQSHGRV